MDYELVVKCVYKIIIGVLLRIKLVVKTFDHTMTELSKNNFTVWIMVSDTIRVLT